MKRHVSLIAFASVLLFAGASLATTALANEGADLDVQNRAETFTEADSVAGLEEINSRRLTQLHRSPSANFAAYDTVLLESTSVDFASYWLRQQQRQGIYLRGEDVDRVRQRLADQADVFFTDYFTEKGYRVVQTAEANTLRVEPRLVNVNVSVPDAGRNKYTNSFGNFGFVTLDVDFADANSEQLLANVRDEKWPRGPQFRWRTVANDKLAFHQLLEEWADALSAELPLRMVAASG